MNVFFFFSYNDLRTDISKSLGLFLNRIKLITVFSSLVLFLGMLSASSKGMAACNMTPSGDCSASATTGYTFTSDIEVELSEDSEFDVGGLGDEIGDAVDDANDTANDIEDGAEEATRVMSEIMEALNEIDDQCESLGAQQIFSDVMADIEARYPDDVDGQMAALNAYSKPYYVPVPGGTGYFLGTRITPDPTCVTFKQEQGNVLNNMEAAYDYYLQAKESYDECAYRRPLGSCPAEEKAALLVFMNDAYDAYMTAKAACDKTACYDDSYSDDDKANIDYSYIDFDPEAVIPGFNDLGVTEQYEAYEAEVKRRIQLQADAANQAKEDARMAWTHSEVVDIILDARDDAKSYMDDAFADYQSTVNYVTSCQTNVGTWCQAGELTQLQAYRDQAYAEYLNAQSAYNALNDSVTADWGTAYADLVERSDISTNITNTESNVAVDVTAAENAATAAESVRSTAASYLDTADDS